MNKIRRRGLALPVNFRQYALWLVRGATAAGVLLSFVTIPPVWAAAASAGLVLFAWILERLPYTWRVLHVAPLPSDYVVAQRMASSWAREDSEGARLIFGQVFRTKAAAREAYRMFRAWNFGRYSDDEGDICLDVVKEELARYTIVLHPGTRGVKEYYDRAAVEQFGSRTAAHVCLVVPFFPTYADYWTKPELREVVESLATTRELLLMTFWMDGTDVRAYAKRPLTISNVRFSERAACDPNSIAGRLAWNDPWTGVSADDRQLVEAADSAARQDQDKISEDVP
jgi:hypothetical protein